MRVPYPLMLCSVQLSQNCFLIWFFYLKSVGYLIMKIYLHNNLLPLVQYIQQHIQNGSTDLDLYQNTYLYTLGCKQAHGLLKMSNKLKLCFKNEKQFVSINVYYIFIRKYRKLYSRNTFPICNAYISLTDYVYTNNWITHDY